jgi:hypothetical protein
LALFGTVHGDAVADMLANLAGLSRRGTKSKFDSLAVSLALQPSLNQKTNTFSQESA